MNKLPVRILTIVFVGGWLIMGAVVLYLTVSDMYRSGKYQKVALGAKIEEVEDCLGVPDRITEGKDNELIYHYYNIGIGDDHIFIFNKQTGKLASKWAGD